MHGAGVLLGFEISAVASGTALFALTPEPEPEPDRPLPVVSYAPRPLSSKDMMDFDLIVEVRGFAVWML
jgi:hypothetical protein